MVTSLKSFVLDTATSDVLIGIYLQYNMDSGISACSNIEPHTGVLPVARKLRRLFQRSLFTLSL